ncbi:MAG: aminopeptidase N [Hyphomicrobiales bacterium]|nr:aminopeptidase N [Hyphomicrobiales bacterium]
MRTDSGHIIRLKNYKIADYQINHIDLHFQLDAQATIVRSVLEIERSKGVDIKTPLHLDGDELSLNWVKLDGEALEEESFKVSSQFLEIFSTPRKKRFTLETEVTINPESNTKLMGLYRSNGKYCTQCEAEGFRRITYFADRPDVLATYTTRIEGDRDDCPILLGNGNPVKKGKLSGNRHFAIWHDPHPKPSYLFALVAGDLGAIFERFKTASNRNVKLGIYVEKGKENQATYAMEALIRSMKWDEEVFGCEYDLDVFNIVAVSDFNMGAMENKGLNIFNDKFVLADPASATDMDYENIEGIIAHEYFHNWTGNRITCRDWFQLCLKEGLTVYRDQEFSADMRSRAVLRIEDVRKLRIHQFSEDSGPLAHAVRPETYREINNFYTATIYEKGAELVRMLATLLGPKTFKKGMNLYFKRHDGEATTIENFLKCFSQAGRINLDQFALWYSQAGTPSIIASSKYDVKSKKLTLELEQNLSPTPGQPRKKVMHIPFRIGLVGKGGVDLKATRITGCASEGDVFNLVKRKHKIVFHGITSRPVLSLNRNFSAPVNLELHQTNTELAFLTANDTDQFNQWQAFQTYAMKLLVNGAKALGRGKAPKSDSKFLDAALAVFADNTLPAAFKAQVLNLPGEGEISRRIGSGVDPDTVHKARNALMGDIGGRVIELWDVVWQETEITDDYQPNAEQTGKRALRNLLLDIGVMANHKRSELESNRQYSTAREMSDRFSALVRIVLRHKSRKTSDQAIQKFYDDFKDNPLVLDKWFSVQAMIPGTAGAKVVRRLMRHEKFTFKNPNRVRSVLASFAFGNPTGFNARSGEGYQLVIRAIETLDKINPQIAARLLTAFRTHGALEKVRRKAAIDVLKKLRENSKLSTDVSEILDLILDG